MAEIASAYPTAGGLYYWASKLGGPGWGWATGWFNLIGQIAVTAAIGYGLAVFAQVLFDYWFNYTAHMNDWFGASFNMSTYILYAAFLLGRGDHQHVQHPDHVGAEHDLGLVAHGRRRARRRHPHHRPRSAPVALVRVHGDGEQLRLRRRDDLVLEPGLLVRVRARTPDVAVHDHGLRRVGTHGGGDEQGVTHGGDRDVDVGLRLGRLRLDPALAVTFAIPDTQSAIDTANNFVPIVPCIWTESMGQHWAEFLLFICVVAQFFCVTASTTSASRMMFAFSRDRAVPGHQLWRRVAKNRVPRWSVLVVAFMGGDAHGAGDLELLHRLCGRNGDRRHRPLHRVHHPRLPPLAEGRQLGRAAGVEPRSALQVARRRLASSGSPSSRSCSSSRSTPSGSRGTTRSTGSSRTTRSSGSRASASSSAAGGRCRRRTGSRARCAWAPRRSSDGSKEERLGEFALPTEAS